MHDIQAGFIDSTAVVFEVDRAKAVCQAVQSATIDDIVLLAGRGHEVEQYIGKEILVASDRDLALRAASSG